MPSDFIVASVSSTQFEPNVSPQFLRDRNLLKTLSLLQSQRAGIEIPPTLLLIEQNVEVVTKMISRWSLPLMMRVDFGSLPSQKPIGGIPLRSAGTINAVIDDLFKHNICPLLHPHIDRFDDFYSVGILLARENPEIQIEVVGKGFDAGDLRLGLSAPHEFFKYNILDDSISSRRLISDEDYKKGKNERAKYAVRLNRYIEFANQTGRLISSISQFHVPKNDIETAERKIPDSYKPLSKSDIKLLAGFAWKLQTRVLPALPSSEFFVASFSLVPRRQWILWDVYGHWYKR